MQTPTHGDAKYFVIFIDDYYWFYHFLFHSLEIRNICLISSLQTFVKNQIDKKIKMLWYDNGIEFKSKDFNAFVNYMELFDNSQMFTPHNKVEFYNENNSILMEYAESVL
jgi:hypothetical protein